MGSALLLSAGAAEACPPLFVDAQDIACSGVYVHHYDLPLPQKFHAVARSVGIAVAAEELAAHDASDIAADVTQAEEAPRFARFERRILIAQRIFTLRLTGKRGRAQRRSGEQKRYDQGS